MLLALVLEFDSHHGEILNFSEKKREANCWERLAAWVGIQFDASRRGKKTLNSSRDKNEGIRYTVVGRGQEEPA